jgi:hypothetical protein
LKKLLLGLCVVLAAVSAQAKQELKGLKEFGIAVDPPDRGALACGITDSLIYTSLRSGLQQSKIRLAAVESPYVYVSVSGSQSCSLTVTIEVYAEMTILETGVRGWGVIWQGRRLVFGLDRNTPRAVSDSIEYLLGKLGSDWSSVNP